MAETGRPTAYKPEYDRMAYRHSLLGSTDEDLAGLFDVTVTTIYNWKNEHPSFFEAIKEGKENADALVAESLYSRATGANGNTPDTTAMIFWLKNRRPKQWRDRPDAEHSANDLVAGMQAIADKLTGGNNGTDKPS